MKTRAPAFLAVDLGAESGRLLLGRLERERLALEEVHRFPNVPVRVASGLHWDVLRLFQEVKDGMAKAASGTPGRIESVGVDSWAVDFGLLDRDGHLLSNPYHYRDRRTEGMMEQAFGRVSSSCLSTRCISSLRWRARRCSRPRRRCS